MEIQEVALFAELPPACADQPPGYLPSGRAAPAVGTTDTHDDALFINSVPAPGPIGVALLAQSPAYGALGEPVGENPDVELRSYVGRLQPQYGFSTGNYAVNTQYDVGTPNGDPAVSLPGIRSGEFPAFSRRLLALGDQGVIDNLLADGGSFVAIDQKPYVSDDRPAGR